MISAFKTADGWKRERELLKDGQLQVVNDGSTGVIARRTFRHWSAEAKASMEWHQFADPEPIDKPVLGKPVLAFDEESMTTSWTIDGKPWAESIDSQAVAEQERQEAVAKAGLDHDERLLAGFRYRGERYSATEKDVQGFMKLALAFDVDRKFKTPFEFANGKTVQMNFQTFRAMGAKLIQSQADSFAKRNADKVAADEAYTAIELEPDEPTSEPTPEPAPEPKPEPKFWYSLPDADGGWLAWLNPTLTENGHSEQFVASEGFAMIELTEARAAELMAELIALDPTLADLDFAKSE